MTRIKIEDLPKDKKINNKEMQKIVGGGGRPVLNFLTNPWALGSIVATAIAIPLALHDDDDGS